MKLMELTFDEEQEQRRSDLVRKLSRGEISLAKAHELRDLLELEKHMISMIDSIKIYQ
jgi:hypothetical protein